MRQDDTSLDELIAAAAPVADHDLDRPDVRATARTLIEELSMTAPVSTRPTAGVASPGWPANELDPETRTVIPLTPTAAARTRRGRRALAAAVVAAVVGLGSAMYVTRADSGDTPVEETGVAGPAVAGQEADPPATACEWTTVWFLADDNDDADGRNRAIAGLAEMAAQAGAAGDEVTALRIETTMSPMSAGHRQAAEEASTHLGC
jgi:hypothetical protein